MEAIYFESFRNMPNAHTLVFTFKNKTNLNLQAGFVNKFKFLVRVYSKEILYSFIC